MTRAQSAKKIKKSKILISCRVYPKNKKEIEIVSGDGSNLDISPVYEDVNTLRPKSNDKKPKDIVIPEPKKK